MEECDIMQVFFFKVKESMNWQKKKKNLLRAKKDGKKIYMHFPSDF